MPRRRKDEDEDEESSEEEEEWSSEEETDSDEEDSDEEDSDEESEEESDDEDEESSEEEKPKARGRPKKAVAQVANPYLYPASQTTTQYQPQFQQQFYATQVAPPVPSVPQFQPMDSNYDKFGMKFTVYNTPTGQSIILTFPKRILDKYTAQLTGLKGIYNENYQADRSAWMFEIGQRDALIKLLESIGAEKIVFTNGPWVAVAPAPIVVPAVTAPVQFQAPVQSYAPATQAPVQFQPAAPAAQTPSYTAPVQFQTSAPSYQATGPVQFRMTPAQFQQSAQTPVAPVQFQAAGSTTPSAPVQFQAAPVSSYQATGPVGSTTPVTQVQFQTVPVGPTTQAYQAPQFQAPKPGSTTPNFQPAQSTFMPRAGQSTPTQIQTSTYSPMNRDPGEIDARYQRRLALYNIAIQKGLQPPQADYLSRMRNNVDFDNARFDQNQMQTLEMYLPRNS